MSLIFYCHEKKLIIEVDGPVHTTDNNIDYDKGRTKELHDLGMTIIRFSNDEVVDNISYVLNKIKEAAQRGGEEQSS